ncbi:MAG TPA: hypothetical protein VGK73_32400 [Polyangiaceae bacterium]
MAGIQNGANKGKPHVIDRPGQEADVDEMFEQLYKRLGALNVLTDRGDIITYDGSNVVRLGRGEEGQVLTSRAASAFGIQWEDRPAGGSTATGAGTMRYWYNGLPYGAL